jgi:hypothetical protein
MSSAFKKNTAPSYDSEKSYETEKKEQTDYRNQDASSNRVNQTDQYGNKVTYTQTGYDSSGNPTYEQTSTMGDTAKEYDTLYRDLSKKYGETAGSFDFDYEKAMTEAGTQAYSAYGERFDRDNKQTNTRLVNQGFDINAEGYNNEMADQSKAQNDAYSSFVRDYVGQLYDSELKSYQQKMSDYSAGMDYGQSATGGDYEDYYKTSGKSGKNSYDKDYDAKYKEYEEKQKQKNAALGGLASVAGTATQAYLKSQDTGSRGSSSGSSR